MIAMFTPGPLEWCIMGLVLVLLFGRRLPAFARNMGQSLLEFKRCARSIRDDPGEQSEQSQ